MFLKVVEDIKKEKEKDGLSLSVISTDGRFTAAGVNIGDLQDIIINEMNGKSIDKEKLKDIVLNNIQRIKLLSVEADSTGTLWNFKIRTKDDYGHYGYEFYITNRRFNENTIINKGETKNEE